MGCRKSLGCLTYVDFLISAGEMAVGGLSVEVIRLPVDRRLPQRVVSGSCALVVGCSFRDCVTVEASDPAFLKFEVCFSEVKGESSELCSFSGSSEGCASMVLVGVPKN